MKPLLTIDELITHMKSKGIRFNIVSEEDAKDFLMHNNYYMKLASYRTNYDKCTTGGRAGQYINLDFGYLQELAAIDKKLRYLIFEMCLDLEHIIKVRLLKQITNNPNEDGYEIIRKFLAKEQNIRILKSIRNHKSGEYCKDLIEKYYPYFPAWVFVELISFGDLMYLCAFYEETYGVTIANNKLLNVVRDIRNASAHSNCLINKLTEKLDPSKQPHNEITNFIKGIPNINAKARGKYLNTKFTYSFVTLLYIYDKLMPETSKKKRYLQLHRFMNTTVIEHKEYFENNGKICAIYNFHKKVVDNLAN